jgi:hypothetical protein
VSGSVGSCAAAVEIVPIETKAATKITRNALLSVTVFMIFSALDWPTIQIEPILYASTFPGFDGINTLNCSEQLPPREA